MAGASGIRAGRAFVEIGAIDVSLTKLLDRAQRRVAAFGSSISSIGQKVAHAGVGAAIPFALSTKAFSDFESAMARIKALRDPTEAQFKELSDLAKQLGRDTVFSATEAANAMAIFAQHGFDLNQIMKATRPTLDLAATAQIGIAEAANIASTILRGMGLEVEDLTTVIDVLAKASTTANTDIMELGEAFKFVGPVAKSAQFSLEEITAAIQVLSNAGIKGEMAGTTLRAMILALGSPSKEAADEMARLGVNIKDQNGNFRSLTDIVGQFQRALAGKGNAEQIESLGKIFSNRAAAGVMELIAQGAEHLGDATQKLGDATGTAARVASVQLNTMRGAIKLVMSSIELLGVEIGSALAPTLRKIADVMMDFVNALSAAAKANPGLILSFAKTTAAAIGVGAALVVAGHALGITAAAIGFLSTPFGLITAGLVGLGAAFLTFTGQGQKAVADFLPTLRSMQDTATQTFGAIANALKGGDLAIAGRIFWGGLKVEWLKGTNYLMDVWDGFASFAMDAFASVGPSIQKGLTNAFYAVQKEWATITNAMTGSFSSAVAKMAELLVKFIDPLGEVLAKVFGVDISKLTERALGAVGLGERDADKKKRVADLGAEHQRIEDERQKALGRIDAAQAADEDLRRGAPDPELEKRKAALADAQAELDSLTSQAEEKAYEASQKAGKELPGKKMRKGPLEGLPRDDIEKGLEGAAKKFDVAGSFSAAALSGMTAGESVAGRLQKQIEESKKQTKQLEKLNDKARAGRLVFTT